MLPKYVRGTRWLAEHIQRTTVPWACHCLGGRQNVSNELRCLGPATALMAGRTYPTNYILLFVFTSCEGVLMGVICANYKTDALLIAAGMTVGLYRP